MDLGLEIRQVLSIFISIFCLRFLAHQGKEDKVNLFLKMKLHFLPSAGDASEKP